MSSGAQRITQPLLDASVPVIVTGLPRSGTSMLMQMLRAGGVPVNFDATRERALQERFTDANPQGFLELGRGAALAGVPAGMATKVWPIIVPRLPLDKIYKVLLITREEAARRRSYDRMRGHVIPEQQHARALGNFAAMRAYLEAQPQSFALLDLAYAQVVADPRATARAIGTFLGWDGWQEESAVAVVTGYQRPPRD